MKSPKLLVTDSGLFGYLLGVHETDDAMELVIETFVGDELHKLVSWLADGVSVLHFRDKRANEVDYILERRDRRVVEIEVKKSRTVGSTDFRGLRKFAEAAGAQLVRGIVLCGGNETLPFGPQLVAIPIAALWTNA